MIHYTISNSDVCARRRGTNLFTDKYFSCVARITARTFIPLLFIGPFYLRFRRLNRSVRAAVLAEEGETRRKLSRGQRWRKSGFRKIASSLSSHENFTPDRCGVNKLRDESKIRNEGERERGRGRNTVRSKNERTRLNIFRNRRYVIIDKIKSKKRV